MEAVGFTLRARNTIEATPISLPTDNEEIRAQFEAFMRGENPQILETAKKTRIFRTHTTACLDSSRTLMGEIANKNDEELTVVGYHNEYWCPDISPFMMHEPIGPLRAYNYNFWGSMETDADEDTPVARYISGITQRITTLGLQEEAIEWGFETRTQNESVFLPFKIITGGLGK